MIEWIITVISVFIAYVIFVIRSSSGSDITDNSIDAFIIGGGNEGLEDAGQTKDQTSEKYKRNYTTEGKQILILYGTEYGFSEEVARKLYDRITEASEINTEEFSFQPRLVNAKYHSVISWDQENVCLIVISTSGDGVPPTDARPCYDMIMESKNSLDIHYAVLALGDSNYPQFCKTGKALDHRLWELSGKRILDCQNVDMEDWDIINTWIDKVIHSLSALPVEVKIDYLDLSTLGQGEGHTRSNPFPATLKVKRLLTQCLTENDKETIHCEFDITGSGLTWTSGDALGIYPQNNPSHVDLVLHHLKLTGKEKISTPAWAFSQYEDEINLRTALMKYFDLKHVKSELLQKMYRTMKNSSQKEKMNNILKTEDQDTLCVTAAVVRYTLLNKSRQGVTTTYLQDRVNIGDKSYVFMSRNPDFRLPSNHNVPVILIGPGTGIAPFRAFLQERSRCPSIDRGYTLLYFGCRHQHSDYLYRDELEAWEKKGIVKLRVAFSRDQEDKIYVQHLIREDSLHIWRLINEEHAYIFVCGDAKNMAHDVHSVLLEIVRQNLGQVNKTVVRHNLGQVDQTEAEKYLKGLEQNNRYQKDVWVT